MLKKNTIIAISISIMLLTCVSFKESDLVHKYQLDGQHKYKVELSQDTIYKDQDTLSFAEELGNKLIRFHVVANSDETEDQSIKLSIRDAILKEIGPQLEKMECRKEALEFLKNNLAFIESIANKILAEGNKAYTAHAFVDKFIFPIKSYGETTLPEGKYTALKVVLGNGSGKNWWCVMFPPLCFIDITRGLASDESDRRLSKVLNKKELGKIENKTINGKNKQKTDLKKSKPKVEIRFKAIDFLGKIFN